MTDISLCLALAFHYLRPKLKLNRYASRFEIWHSIKHKEGHNGHNLHVSDTRAVSIWKKITSADTDIWGTLHISQYQYMTLHIGRYQYRYNARTYIGRYRYTRKLHIGRYRYTRKLHIGRYWYRYRYKENKIKFNKCALKRHLLWFRLRLSPW